MSRKARKNVGVIGLGIIGSRVAASLRSAGYQAYVWNRSAKPAPNFLGSPAEVAEAADIIQIFVSDAAALFEIIEAMGDALTAKHVIVCCATVGPEAVLEAAQLVETKGAQFLDAPFTGSKLAAEKGQLVYYIGGSEHTFLKVKPVLEVTSKAIVRIGEVGHAATVKVVTNMISAVTAQVLAEALSIVQKAGLEPEILGAAIEHNACRSGMIDLKLPKMIAGDYDPHFSLKHMFKDVQLGIHMANALDLEIPATTVTAGVMYGALNQGWAEKDFSVLYQNYAPSEAHDVLPALLPIERLAEEALPPRDAARDETAGASQIKPLESGAADGGLVRIPERSGPMPAAAADSAEVLPPAAPTGESPDANSGDEEMKSRADSSERMIEAVIAQGNADPTSGVLVAPLHRAEDEAPEKSAAIKTEPLAGKGARAGEKGELHEPAPDEGEAGEPSRRRANNFVKRWFVSRIGG